MENTNKSVSDGASAGDAPRETQPAKLPDISAMPDVNLPTTPAATQQSKLATLKDTLDLFGKLIFGLAGLCYVLGVVVVALHLRQYGVNSLDLPQLHYITAGVWVVLPLALIVTLVVFGGAMTVTGVEDIQPERKWKGRVNLALSLVAILGIVIWFLASRIGIELNLRNVLIPLVGMLATLFLAVGMLTLSRVSGQTRFREVIIFAGNLVLGLILFSVYVYYFAAYTYKSIPWATGGGRTSRVQLFLTPESAPYIRSLKVALAPEQSKEAIQTAPIDLLLTTEKQFVVINAEGKAVSFPSDIVKGVTYEK